MSSPLPRLLLSLSLSLTIGACALDEPPPTPPPDGVSDPLDRDVVDDEGFAGANLGDGDLAVPAADAFAVPTAAACAVAINPGRELVIRSLGVVNDPVRTRWTGSLATPSDGAWQFGRLMTAMAGGHDAAAFVRTWLHSWEVTSTVNGFVAPARTAITGVIAAWPKRPDGSLDLTRAPLRLLAITNRFDLRGAGNAGEGRFVFGVLDGSGAALPFTVILEYKLPAATAAEVASWATDWHKLQALVPGSATYNAQLQHITDRFAGKGAAPGRPNGSSIGQVRTNEIALASPWQLREFHLSLAGNLVEATVLRTPANGFMGSAELGRFVNANQAAILAGTHGVPLLFESKPFRANAINNTLAVWNATNIVSHQARHLFSLNTCNGCHGNETGTTFLQIGTREPGQLAPLAGFLTGISVADPVTGVTRTFNDLQRRAVILKNFLCSGTPASAADAARSD